MYDYIKGTVEGYGQNSVVMERAGIGYRCYCSYNTMLYLQSQKGEVKLFVNLSIKENALELYGFANSSEREMFIALTGVPKVGPKVALNILSLFTPDKVISHINSEDVKGLTRVGGVGKKLAESIIFNMKDKFGGLTLEASADASEILKNASAKDEALMALDSLGFDRGYSIELINSIYKDSMGVEDIISEALRKAGEEK
ncbi:MAG: Holliday junction branch migration protein RuvA [Eubacteriaceae bacterium]|nr:Holliday junction branch migration protein RuvA [Eubacteriaceae bacterium]